MLCIRALNDESHTTDEKRRKQTTEVNSTTEAQESEAIALYNEALQQRQCGNTQQAEQTFRNLLESVYIQKAAEHRTVTKENDVVPSSVLLHYSVLKNLAELAETVDNMHDAMEFYLEAVSVDSSDVSMWYKIGKLALTLCNYSLARHAFETGLDMNCNHWPCLDNVITVLYALNNYEACLHYISMALDKDPSYIKGIALKEKICVEFPHLDVWSMDLFRNCDPVVFTHGIDNEQLQQYVEEAMTMRHKKRQLADDIDQLSRRPIVEQLTTPTWKCVGECLVSVYQHVSSTILSQSHIHRSNNTTISFNSCVNLILKRQITAIQQQQQQQQQQQLETSIVTQTESQALVGMEIHAANEVQVQTDCKVQAEQTGGQVESVSNMQTDSMAQLQIDNDGMTELSVDGGTEVQYQQEAGSSMSIQPDSNVPADSGVVQPDSNVPADSGVVQPDSNVPADSGVVQPDSNVPADSGVVQPDSNVPADSGAVQSSNTTRTTVSDASAVHTNVTSAGPNVSESVSDAQLTPKRGRKRRYFDIVDPFLDASKRRSTRMRNSNVKSKEELTVNYREQLNKFLPHSLRLAVSDVNSSAVESLNRPTTTTTTNNISVRTETQLKKLSDELQQVRQFLTRHESNAGVIDLLLAYLLELSEQWKVLWPDGLVDVYIKAYKKLRKHMTYPDYYSNNCPLEQMRRLAVVNINKPVKYITYNDCLNELLDRSEIVPSPSLPVFKRQLNCSHMCLVQQEFILDKSLHTQTATMSSLSNSPRRSPAVCNIPVNVGFTTDLEFLVRLLFVDDLFDNESFHVYCTRVCWLHARYSAQHNDLQLADYYLTEAIEHLQILEQAVSPTAITPDSDSMNIETSQTATILLPNCSVDNCITLATVQQQLESLRKSQSLGEVYRLVETGEHERVVELLLPLLTGSKTDVDMTLTDSTTTTATTTVDIALTDRCRQILVLIESLVVLNDYERTFVCCESLLNEVLKKYFTAATKSPEQLVDIIIELLNKLHRCIECNADIISCIAKPTCLRLANNLIELITVVMETSESDGCGMVMLIPSIVPWILLSSLVCFGEQLVPSDGVCEMLPSSLSLLLFAHQHLGRHAWCTSDDGRLLLFTVRLFSDELIKLSNVDDPPTYKDELEAAMEQCFYCLYGHPNKRAKAKHLEDHNVGQVPLTWEHCQVLFDFFKPKTLPEYDNYKSCAVNAELECLLRRIIPLIPVIENKVTLDSLSSYIYGSTNVAPVDADINPDIPAIVCEIYYLLADYYFNKTKEMSKAIKHYMLDLCYNPERVDSWAGMALARQSRLENKLSSHELKLDAPIQKHAVSTLCCFKRALQLDSSSVKLWIEYGSTAFLIHSHASRTIKQKYFESVSLPLPSDVIQQVTANYSEMLQLADECYCNAASASEDNDLDSVVSTEEWLLHYMRGKIAEKLNKEPAVYLDHYCKAAHNLHIEKARYPRKINYYTVPQFAVEALEVFYRLHVSVIKYLLSHESHLASIPFQVLEKYIHSAASSPFVLCVEKERKPDKQRQDCDDTMSQGPTSTVDKAVRLSRSSKHIDHSYSNVRTDVLTGCLPLDSVCLPTEDQLTASLVGSVQLADEVSSEPTTVRQSVTVDDSDALPIDLSHWQQTDNIEFCCLEQLEQKDVTDIQQVPADSQRLVAVDRTMATDEPVTDMSVARTSPRNEDLPLKKRLRTDSLTSDIGCQQMSTHEPTVKAELQCSDEPAANVNNELSGVQPTHHSSSELTDAVSLPTSCLLTSSNESIVTTEQSASVFMSAVAMETAVESQTVATETAVESHTVAMETAVESQTVAMETAVESHTVAMETAVESHTVSAPSDDVSNISRCDVKVESDVSFAVVSNIDNNQSLTSFAPYIKTEQSDSLTALTESVSLPTAAPDCAVMTLQSVVSQVTVDSLACVTESASLPVCDVKHETMSTLFDVPLSESLSLVLMKTESLPTAQQLVAMETDAESYVVPAATQLSPAANSLQDVKPVSLSPAAPQPPKSNSDSAVDLESVVDQYTEMCNTAMESVTQQQHRDLAADVGGASDNVNGVQCQVEPASDINKGVTTTTAELQQQQKLDVDMNQQEMSQNETCLLPGTEQCAVSSMERKEFGVKYDTRTELQQEETEQKETQQLEMEQLETEQLKTEQLETVKTTSNEQRDNNIQADNVAAAGSDLVCQPVVSVAAAVASTSETPAAAAAAESCDGDVEHCSEAELSEKFECVMKQCVKALELCLSRFPQHYKSLYRLADIYFTSTHFKNIECSRDILLGTEGHQTPVGLPCQGLFQERKSSNFFQGLWRIPSEEVDRTGSFAAHLCKCLLLLFDVLKSVRDAKLLFNIHKQLAPQPTDVAKKYLRDVDRVNLSRLALLKCLDTVECQLGDDCLAVGSETARDVLLLVAQVRQYVIKMVAVYGARAEKLLTAVYCAYTGNKMSVHCDAIVLFCTRLQADIIHRNTLQSRLASQSCTQQTANTAVATTHSLTTTVVTTVTTHTTIAATATSPVSVMSHSGITHTAQPHNATSVSTQPHRVDNKTQPHTQTQTQCESVKQTTTTTTTVAGFDDDDDVVIVDIDDSASDSDVDVDELTFCATQMLRNTALHVDTPRPVVGGARGGAFSVRPTATLRQPGFNAAIRTVVGVTRAGQVGVARGGQGDVTNSWQTGRQNAGTVRQMLYAQQFMGTAGEWSRLAVGGVRGGASGVRPSVGGVTMRPRGNTVAGRLSVGGARMDRQQGNMTSLNLLKTGVSRSAATGSEITGSTSSVGGVAGGSGAASVGGVPGGSGVSRGAESVGGPAVTELNDSQIDETSSDDVIFISSSTIDSDID